MLRRQANSIASLHGRRTIFSAIKNIVNEIRGFGDEETSDLKKQLERQKEELEELKILRAERRKQEEQIILMELRRAVGSMKNMESSLKQQETNFTEATDKLEKRLGKIMEADMQQRAVDLLQSVDYQTLLQGPHYEVAAATLVGTLMDENKQVDAAVNNVASSSSSGGNSDSGSSGANGSGGSVDSSRSSNPSGRRRRKK